MTTLLTRSDLAAMLAKANVEQVAKESGVSAKTIYRLRHQKHAPTLDTADKLLAALRRINALQPAPETAAEGAR